MSIDRRREEMILRQSEMLEAHSSRLAVAHAWIVMLREAYAALLHHGVNYQELPEFQNPVDLENVTTPANRKKAIEWIIRLKSGIRAAVTRKGWTVH